MRRISINHYGCVPIHAHGTISAHDTHSHSNSLMHSHRADNAVNVNWNAAYEMTQGSYEKSTHSRRVSGVPNGPDTHPNISRFFMKLIGELNIMNKEV